MNTWWQTTAVEHRLLDSFEEDDLDLPRQSLRWPADREVEMLVGALLLISLIVTVLLLVLPITP